jgi:hypothetical protein
VHAPPLLLFTAAISLANCTDAVLTARTDRFLNGANIDVMAPMMCLCLAGMDIITLVRRAMREHVLGGFDCNAHFKPAVDGSGEPTDGTKACMTHYGTWSSTLTAACPPIVSVYLNVSGKDAPAVDAPKSYNVKSVPEQFGSADLGFAELEGDACTYELFSVWCHEGETFESGHWFAFVKTADRKWWKVDKMTSQEVRFRDIPFRYVHFAVKCLTRYVSGIIYSETACPLLPGT